MFEYQAHALNEGRGCYYQLSTPTRHNDTLIDSHGPNGFGKLLLLIFETPIGEKSTLNGPRTWHIGCTLLLSAQIFAAPRRLIIYPCGDDRLGVDIITTNINWIRWKPINNFFDNGKLIQ